ncbi:fibro-slime domain-containing protein [Blautia massiliensis]|uniref:SpaA isopeptide-forming pilin-related protein n=1 Tax=Blautia TaxID=572511 RepID=UPI001570CB10|nr:SpaA isopeptide-forming pilin-related protein [Blautia sp. MSK22_86]MCC2726421.1 fibro-slime domain-containing protein [Blautia sp. MSK22_86]NSF58163.1 fibro-slime domain-containing protein [Blautia massiliensis (ex Durand et al. 2017)]NSK73581.1 fibro-slime domain-containing protein [Blautia massiliensis (ex Durand et al. 2017)]
MDGEEVQPGASVKVSVSLNDEKKIKDADVYHVDENDNVENMDGSVAKNGDVEFETTHFSTYVIVGNKRDDKIKVTIEHYDATTKEKIYADDVDKELSVGQKIDCKKATNWDITRVEVFKDGTTTTVNEGDIELAQDATVKVYYTPTTGTFAGAPTFYDYTVKAGQSGNTYYSINMPDNYTDKYSNRFAVGGGDNYGVYTTGLYSWTKDNKAVNSWTSPNGVTITGLITGLNSDGSVKFSCADPGLFDNTDKKVTVSNQERYLRRVYKDYTLNFTRTGDTYLLSGIKDGNNKDVTENYNGTTGYNFFPLDDVKVNYEGAKTSVAAGETSDKNVVAGNHNYYFGMRYDVKFSIGDYVGPLNYTFKGDDDMWVLLDGKKVVIDLGGIHNAVEGSVNLWDHLKQGDATTHTLTILYMERGAGASNCYMNFTLPNATISQVTTDALGTLNFQKVNKEGAGLSGARFALYNDEECTTQIATATSDDDGIVTFDKLRAGTYYLKEIQAPVGYVASNEKWTVTVRKDSDTQVTTTLSDSSGNAVKDNKIVNETPEEIIKSSMEYSKTAKVDSWDDRTYDINIKAASTSTSSVTTTTKAIADIMLVLDVSGSMDDEISSETVYTYVADNTSSAREKLYKWNTYYVEVNGSHKTMKYSYLSRDWYIGDEKASKYDGSNYKIYEERTVTKTKLDALKESVDQFITDTASKSPESKIGITAFSSSGYGYNGKSIDLKEVNKSGLKDLKDFTNELKANGGTDPQVGLNDAKDKLNKLKNDGRPKYVILFTDGMPTGGGDTWSTTAQKAAETSAKELKQAGYTVYTIGYGFSANSSAAKFLAGDGTKKYPGIASPNCAFTANDATRLGEIFRDIQNTITQDIEITGAKVTDVIDSRFDLLDENGSPIVLEEGGIANAYGGTVSLVNGNYQIQWTDQTIPNKKNGEWNKTIKVKAKDNFVGGNNVTTNVSPGSKISTGYGAVELPQPTVNVKVNLVVKDKDVWIYKGDRVPTNDEILNQLFSESETSYSKGTISAVDAENHITLQWFKKDKDGNQTNISKEDMATTPDDDTEYYLEVTYNPNEASTDKSKANTNQYVVGDAEKAYNPKNSNNPYGIYKIHVIKGQIQITKNVRETSDANRTFTFNVNAKKGQNVSNSQVVSVTVKANETSGTVTLSDLSRGEYTVTEDNADGYFIQAFDIVTGDGQTDCENFKSDADKSLKFTLGNDVNKANVITTDYTYTSGGVKGVASYTNEAVTSLDLKKTDTENNPLTGAKFKLEIKSDDGTWNTVGDEVEVKNGASDIELNNLKAGIYKLTETTAPKGYSLLGSSIYFKVATGNVTLVDENGDPAQASNMWSLENKVLTIKNTKLYSLPESGGPGTYGFTISGVAILATALLLFINNKRREEEAKRS